MLNQIVDASQLQASAERLRATLRHHAYRERLVVWGTPSGRRDEFATYVLRARSHDIYVGIGDGVARPDTYSHLLRLTAHDAEPTSAFAPDVEVNISKIGRQGAGGLFAIEGERLFLCRRAIFTAFRGRIKEDDALEYFGNYTVVLRTTSGERRALPVVALDSPTFIDDLEDFIERAQSLKEYFKGGLDTADSTKQAKSEGRALIWPWNC